MKKYLYIAVTILVASILSLILYQKHQIAKYKELYNKELSNVLAYQTENSGYKDRVLQYQMTIKDLEYSKDSIDQKLYKALKDLKVKPKTVESIQYLTSTVTKTDTISFRDTIFSTRINKDTILNDDWYTLNLGLYYPSSIKVVPTFKSEKFIIAHTKKEYLNKPSKVFFIRWFQKKRKVVEIIVEEKNPYIDIKENKFIKVVE